MEPGFNRAPLVHPPVLGRVRVHGQLLRDWAEELLGHLVDRFAVALGLLRGPGFLRGMPLGRHDLRERLGTANLSLLMNGDE
eukprot:3717243-Prymnesium_polylepis.1